MGPRPWKKVHRIFYDEAYAHPWLKLFFADIDQEYIEKQQTLFMSKAMGGPKRYFGRFVPQAHEHIFIPQELFDLRHDMLARAMLKAGVPDALREEWLRIDKAFERRVVKNGAAECRERWSGDGLRVFRKP